MTERPVEWTVFSEHGASILCRVFPDHAGRVLDAMERNRAEKLLTGDVYVVRPELPKLLRKQA